MVHYEHGPCLSVQVEYGTFIATLLVAEGQLASLEWSGKRNFLYLYGRVYPKRVHLHSTVCRCICMQLLLWLR